MTSIKMILKLENLLKYKFSVSGMGPKIILHSLGFQVMLMLLIHGYQGTEYQGTIQHHWVFSGSPDSEDPLEKSMATHSSILAWRISMDTGDWQASVHGVAKSQTQLSD